MQRSGEPPGVRIRSLCWVACVGAVLAAATAPRPCSAQPTEPVLRVEEDWLLVLGIPDGAVVSPQFHSAMSPYGHVDSIYAQATWNYRSEPDFDPGGLQVQVWDGDALLKSKNVVEEPMDSDAETITWTQVMETDGEFLLFGVLDGSSTSWGTFGGWETTIVGRKYIPDLSGYSTSVSVANSWITYGSNRVEKLVITEVRYYGEDDDDPLWVDTAPKVVFEAD